MNEAWSAKGSGNGDWSAKGEGTVKEDGNVNGNWSAKEEGNRREDGTDMIPLKYRPDKKKETEYLNLVTSNRSRAYLKDIDEKCRRYLGLSFDQVILLTPEGLMDAGEAFDARPASDRDMIRKEFNSIRKANNHYIQKVLYKDMPSKARKIAFDNAGVKTCPYCNRSFIQVVKVKAAVEYRSFFQLDHFLNESTYPMFAVSLCNLIPSCPSCNMVKLTKKFQYYPYDEENRSDDIGFGYSIKGGDYLTDEELIEIEIENHSPKITGNVDGLYLEELYRIHRDVVQEIARKVKVFGDGYLDSMCEQFPSLFPDRAEAYRTLYGNYYEAVDFTRRPLAKFTRDIYEDSVGKKGI